MRTPTVQSPRGFSLVEVLIGILILALGLLGLGAIIPLVVREQRDAADTRQGISAANDAQHLLETRTDYYTPNLAQPDVRFPVYWWEPWARDQAWSPVTASANQDEYLWAPWDKNEMDVDAGSWSGSATGNYLFTANGSGNANQHNLLYPVSAGIPLTDRLWPPLSGQGAEITPPGLDPYRPLFVWDIVGRRVPPPPDQLDAFDRYFGAALNPNDRPAILESRTRLQIAIFVRRIDLGIRIPSAPFSGGGAGQRSITLYDVLTMRAGLNGSFPYAYRVPLGVTPPAMAGNALGGGSDPLGNGRAYLPTNTGIAPPGAGVSDLSYSGPLMLATSYDTSAAPDRFTFAAGFNNDNRFRLISQPGQKIVDNLGNIYTVLGVPDDLLPGAPPTILVAPPIPAWVPAQNAPLPSALPVNPYTIRQLVFTPQIPAAIKVFTINPPTQ